jgi:anti-sigma-K factor RskA
MNHWRLLIIAASAAAALAVGLGAQAKPEPTTLQALVTAVASPLGADVQFR